MNDKGVIQQIGTPYEIFEQPVNPFVFNFMGIANFLAVRLDGGRYLAGTGSQEIPWQQPENSGGWLTG